MSRDTRRWWWQASPWIAVGTMIVGAVVVGLGLILGSVAVDLVGAGIVLAGLIFAVVTAKTGVGKPVSFVDEHPDVTPGPRGTGTNGGNGVSTNNEQAQPGATPRS
jgi:hypothetical protein